MLKAKLKTEFINKQFAAQATNTILPTTETCRSSLTQISK